MRRRISVLVTATALVVWLVCTDPREEEGALLNAPWFYARALAQDTCCLNEGETDPHDECVDGTCASVSGCGVSDCSACTGCDPNEEWYCINNNGSWDSNTCTCTYGCDPYEEEQCYYSGGTWDPVSCYCEPGCNPGSPEVDYVIEEHYQYCDRGPGGGGDVWDCDGSWTHYVVYCQDGSVYYDWTEFTEACASTGEYCS
jgi:hypothetical protein